MTPQEAAKNFCFEGTLVDCDRHGNGHINDTFLAVYKKGDGSLKRYILQRVYTAIFHSPDDLMGNIVNVTNYLKSIIEKEGGDPKRETMIVIPTREGKSYFQEDEICFWRAYDFIEDSICLERVEKKEDFYQSAYAFGRFQNLLSTFDASILAETIPNFHNTQVRFQRFKEVVETDTCKRVSEVEKEISFVMERESDMHSCTDMLASGELPLRVTHNDTKLNNVMLDKATMKGLCVIDLDTVMPGLSINDFGDSIRFGANTASEDETDLSKVKLSLELFEAYTEGFLEGCKGSLTDKELEMLPVGAKMMTLECGMRFLTDYLEGDVYFKTHRPKHNLDRARCQFALVKDMELKMNDMHAIVSRIAAKHN